MLKHIFHLAKLFATRAIGSAAQFFLTIAISQLFGREALGVYALSYNLGNVAGTAADIGLPRFTLAEITSPSSEKFKNRIRPLLTRSILYGIGICLTLITAGIIITRILYYTYDFSLQSKTIIDTTILFGSLYVLCRISSDSLKGLDRQSTAIFIEYGMIPVLIIFQMAIIYAFLPDLIYSNENNLIAPYALVLSALLVAAISVLICLRSAPRESIRIKDISKISFKQLRSQWSVNIFQVVAARLPYLVLPVYASTSQIGTFSAALNISILASILMYSINTYFLPKYAKARENHFELKKLYRQAKIIGTTIYIPLFLVILFEGNFILSIYGTSFERGYSLLIILSVGQFISIILAHPTDMLTVIGKSHLASRSTLIIMCYGATAMAILGYTFGTYGIAIAQAMIVSGRSLLSMLFLNRSFST